MQYKPKKERLAIEWLKTIPEEVVNFGKRLMAAFNNKIDYYPPEYWETRPECEFEEYLKKLYERKAEIFAEQDVENLAAMFTPFELINMMNVYPIIRENCPKFLLRSLRYTCMDDCKISILSLCEEDGDVPSWLIIPDD